MINEGILKSGTDSVSRFIKIYSGLPIEERSQVIAVLNDQPINWNMAYREIKQSTELGKHILQTLEKLGII